MLLFCGSPILQLMGWGLVPDLPLIFLALLIAPRVLQLSQTNKVADWLWLGLFLGLAGLSKYTAVFLPFGLVIFLFLKRGWSWLFTPDPWLAAMIALVVISPVLIWNMQHEWASFDYQLSHANGGGWSWRKLLTMQLVQMLCYGFVVCLGGVIASLGALRKSSGAIAELILMYALQPCFSPLYATGEYE